MKFLPFLSFNIETLANGINTTDPVEPFLARNGLRHFGSNGEMRSDGTFMTAATLIEQEVVTPTQRHPNQFDRIFLY